MLRTRPRNPFAKMWEIRSSVCALARELCDARHLGSYNAQLSDRLSGLDGCQSHDEIIALVLCHFGTLLPLFHFAGKLGRVGGPWMAWAWFQSTQNPVMDHDCLQVF